MMPLNLSKSPLISAQSSFVSFPHCFLRCPSSWDQLCLNCSWFMWFLSCRCAMPPTIHIIISTIVFCLTACHGMGSARFTASTPNPMGFTHTFDPPVLLDSPGHFSGDFHDLQ